jgi:hypothetical protein
MAQPAPVPAQAADVEAALVATPAVETALVATPAVQAAAPAVAEPAAAPTEETADVAK